ARSEVVGAAQHLATGNLAGAEQLLPAAGREALAAGYSAAFSSLLWVLTVITVLTAAVVFLFLDRGQVEDGAADGTTLDPAA
ncbi:hypothetical protein PF70_05828, partial [Pseudomonas asplenii]